MKIEIIAKVTFSKAAFRAEDISNGRSVTSLVNDQAKLKYAFKNSGYVRGIKGDDGKYKWRATSNVPNEIETKKNMTGVDKHAKTIKTIDVLDEDCSEVRIGSQVWMVKNLNVDKFLNGEPIPEAKTDEEWDNANNLRTAAWCYYENTPANGDKYGKLYNWFAVSDPRGLAPHGWHIPSDDEWSELVNYLNTSDAGTKMKSKEGWNVSENSVGNGSNESGFSGLPGGVRSYEGISGFNFKNQWAYWWSCTEDSEYDAAWGWHLDCDETGISRFNYHKISGFSIRCIKD